MREPDRDPWGEWIALPTDRVDDVVAAVRERHPIRRGRVTCIGTGGRVVAKAHIDLQAIVDEVLG